MAKNFLTAQLKISFLITIFLLTIELFFETNLWFYFLVGSSYSTASVLLFFSIFSDKRNALYVLLAFKLKLVLLILFCILLAKLPGLGLVGSLAGMLSFMPAVVMVSYQGADKR